MQPAPDDIVIIKVATHYHVGRVRPDPQSIEPIEILNHRAEAIAIACHVVTFAQKVYVYDDAQASDCEEVNCGLFEPLDDDD
jgi:hypothetical protein